MNEQAQQVLADMMQRALDGVDAAVDFSQAQIPDVVEQLLMWHTVESLLFFSLGLILMFFSISLPFAVQKLRNKKMTKEEARGAYEKGEAWTRYEGSGSVTSIEYDRIMKQFDGEWDEVRILSIMTAGFLFAMSGLIIISNIAWLKIMVAPKLYLLEYAASLVK